MFLFFAGMFIVLIMIPAFYAAKAGIINGALLSLTKFQLKLFTLFSAEAQTAWEHIASLDPAALTWERMEGILSYTGKWTRWIYALFLVLFALASLFMGRIGGLVRRLNMESLLKNNAESFACLTPIMECGKYLLSPESYDAGNWRIARSPIQFAAENGLLVDENGAAFAPDQVLRHGLGHADMPAYGQARLDEQKAALVLTAQLGDAFAGFEKLTPRRMALAAAFFAYAGGDKKECVGILDAVSRSYTEQNGVCSCAVLDQGDFTSRLHAAWEKHKALVFDSLPSRHTAFELPWFMGLLTQARKKGVLASSQFLWLRPLDRPLWYALSQCGGRAAWAEGFAAWAHYAAEEKTGKPLSEPHLAQAVAALREALAVQGWLTDKPASSVATPQADAVSGNASPVPKPVVQNDVKQDSEMVFAPAEENPEYDANNDPALKREQF
ncbi:MAG: hypothetical protein LBB60_07790 [Desulfovibrio sp.]|nr:hypothetical protein [Desulfovibrio sp.]